MNFLAELRRRNVIRMAGLYLVGAWLIVQVASTIFPAFELPGWALRGVILVLAIGFIPVLVFSWVFELTPQGIKRDAEVPTEQSIAPLTARRMERVFLMLAVLALSYFAVDKFVLSPKPETTFAATAPTLDATLVPTEAKSIAVLPFANMSGKPDEDYFSDGMTEELLNVLAKVPKLQVVARTSVFQFKGKSGDVREIGSKLGVGHIVEGSIRREGEQVRITAQLVRVSDGFHVWSETYDRRLDSVFALQDEIATRIGEQLVASLVVSPPGTARSAIDPTAYDEFLKGRALLRARKDMPTAITHFRAATEKAPALAAAWSSLSLACEAWFANSVLTSAEQQQGLACEAEGAERAAELDPDSAASEHALANMARSRLRFAEAERHYLRAIQLDPGYPDGLEDYAELLALVGRVEESARESEKLVKLDPYFIIGWVRMREVAMARDRRADIEMITSKLRSLSPDTGFGKTLPYIYALSQGRADEARTALAKLRAARPEWVKQHEIALSWALRKPGVDPTQVDAALLGVSFGGYYQILHGDVPRYDAYVEATGVAAKQYYFSRLLISRPAGHAMLRDPRVKEKLVEYGFVAYWREKGWPAICRPLSETDFGCGLEPAATRPP